LAKGLREVSDDFEHAHLSVAEYFVLDPALHCLTDLVFQVRGALGSDCAAQHEVAFVAIEQILQCLFRAHQGHDSLEDLRGGAFLVLNGRLQILLKVFQLLLTSLSVKVRLDRLDELLRRLVDMQLENLRLAQVFVLFIVLALKELNFFQLG
jgi:hypothetical protein